MRFLGPILALASLAAACGSHGHDDHEWTAEELAELEHKWGMEVRSAAQHCDFYFLPMGTLFLGQCPGNHRVAGSVSQASSTLASAGSEADGWTDWRCANRCCGMLHAYSSEHGRNNAVSRLGATVILDIRTSRHV